MVLYDGIGFLVKQGNRGTYLELWSNYTAYYDISQVQDLDQFKKKINPHTARTIITGLFNVPLKWGANF
jgi:hypothetical protein